MRYQTRISPKGFGFSTSLSNLPILTESLISLPNAHTLHRSSLGRMGEDTTVPFGALYPISFPYTL